MLHTLSAHILAAVVAFVPHVSPDGLRCLCCTSRTFNHSLTKGIKLDTALFTACLVGKVGVRRILTNLHALFEQYEAHQPVPDKMQEAMMFNTAPSGWEYPRSTRRGINQKAESLVNNSSRCNPKFEVEIKQDMPGAEDCNLMQWELYVIANCLRTIFKDIQLYYMNLRDDEFDNNRVGRNQLKCWEVAENKALIYHHFWRTVATTAMKHVFNGGDTKERQALRQTHQIHILSEFVRRVVSRIAGQRRSTAHFHTICRDFGINK